MPIPNSVAAKLSSPLVNVMSFLEQLVLPGGYGLGSPGGDGAANYGTAMPARRNFKPFIVGLIPPDVPVNFVPFKRVQSTVADIQSTALPPGASAGAPAAGRVTTTFYAGTGNRGLEQGVTQVTKTGAIRQSVYESYFKQTGHYPSEKLVNWMTAQMMVERGGSTSSVSSTNFNFGNTHASGARAPVGQIPPTPSGGSYYLSQDVDGQGKPYAVYFRSFQSADDGVAFQVNRILVQWNDSANATSIDQYAAGLLPGPTKNYHETPPDKYLYALNLQTDRLEAAVAKGQAGGHIGGAPDVDSPSLTVSTVNTQPQVARSIMTVGSSTQAESDPAGDRIGKLVQFDPDRQAVARRQTDALRRQIDAISATPGLLMMVNPSEFTRAFEPSVDNTVKGRYGNIVHVWLERPTVLSCSGVTSGQYVLDANGNGGLSGELRTYSASYLNLLSLLSIYKTNGIIYSGPEADLGIAMLGYSVFIYFDNFIYVGSFDSFEVTDTDMKPHNMAYSFRFNVRYFFDVGNDGRFTDFEIGVNTGFFPRVSV